MLKERKNDKINVEENTSNSNITKSGSNGKDVSVD
jgi:hypothetical protein